MKFLKITPKNLKKFDFSKKSEQSNKPGTSQKHFIERIPLINKIHDSPTNSFESTPQLE